MRILLRNFYNTLNRFRMASLLNILGLSVAFAAFMIILIQARYDLTFDKFRPQSDRIFMVQTGGNGSEFGYYISRPIFEDFARSSPHVRAASLMDSKRVVFSPLKDKAQQEGFRATLTHCQEGLTEIVDFHLVEGSLQCLSQPGQVMIPQSLARTLFGQESAIGRTLFLKDRVHRVNEKYFTIEGVYRDLPENSHFHNDIYTGFGQRGEGAWGEFNYNGFVLLDDPQAGEEVIENFKRTYPDHFNKIPFFTDMQLIWLPDVYYMTSGDKNATRILLMIALLIILIATINFTNFSTALTPMRIKSINTQKVLGSPVSLLRKSLIFEAVGICAIAFLCACLWVRLATDTPLFSFLTATLNLGANPGVLWMTAGVALFIGLIAGLYPAYYMTSFQPALALKGSFGLSPRGRKLRTVLISVQFIVSIALIIGSLFVRLQNHFLRSASLGFDKDHVAIVELSSDIARAPDTYVNLLKAYPGIEDIAFAGYKLGAEDNRNNWGGRDFMISVSVVSDNFLKVMNIPVTAGRDFRAADHTRQDVMYTCILNERAAKELNLAEGDQFPLNRGMAEVAGFTADIKNNTLKKDIIPHTFLIQSGYTPALSLSYVKLNAGTDIVAASEYIRKTLKTLDEGFPFAIQFYDQILDATYHREMELSRLITLFCLLAVVISLVGVFGLVVFETQYRRKEIGVRKVFGATVGEILGMFNRFYVRIVIVCFAVATPLAYYGVSRWLETFAYRIPMYMWVYVAALCIVLLITVATVTVQSYRAATANPAESLKTE